MNLLSHKLFILAVNVFLSVLAAAWFWRRRAALEPASTGSNPALVAVACSCAAMLLFGWWNGTSIYMADESLYLLGSNNYLAGRWMGDAPPLFAKDGSAIATDYLPFYLVRNGEQMFPMYPLGWPAILAGMRALLPLEYTGPLLGITTLLLAYFYCRRFLPAGTADGTAWVLALSASFFLNCVGFMSHAPTAVLILAGAIFLERAMESGRWRDMLLSSLFFGAALVVRPVPGALGLVAMGLAFWWKFSFVRAILAGIPGTLSAFLLLTWQNANTTGQWYRSGYTQYIMDNGLIVFGGPTLIPLQTRRLADTLTCSYPLLLALLVAAFLHPATRRRSSVYLACFVATVVAHAILMPIDSDSPIGERYYFEAMLFVFMVGGMGWSNLAGWLGPKRRWLLPAMSILVAAYPIWHLAGVHHELRAPHALLLREKEALSRDASLVYVEPVPEKMPSRNFWVNPQRWKEAKTVFLCAPPVADRAKLAEALGRPDWKVAGLGSDGKSLVEIGRAK